MIDIAKLFEKVSTSPIKQISINCDLHFPTLMTEVMKEEGQIMGMKKTTNRGYNALNGQFEDLLEAGIIEPKNVLTSALSNAISVAQIILSSRFIINLIPETDAQPKSPKS